MIDIREVWEIADDPKNFLHEMFEYLDGLCCFGADIDMLNHAQRILYLVLHTRYAVEFSGFPTALSTFPDKDVLRMAEAFQTIGAQKTAEICHKAANAYGKPLPSDLSERADMTDDMATEALQALFDHYDDEFEHCGDDLTALCFAYVMDCPDSFGK